MHAVIVISRVLRGIIWRPVVHHVHRRPVVIMRPVVHIITAAVCRDVRHAQVAMAHLRQDQTKRQIVI